MTRAIDRFWFGLDISPARLALFRIAFFAVLGVDAFVQIAHAPRYGFGNFNVPHFDFLDIGVGRELMLTVYIVQAYLAFRIAAGDVSRLSIGVLTFLWGGTYFVSQLDSYQHHYLVFLILFACCFVPWRGDRNPWAIRLVLCQISIVYVFAAIAKLEPSWLDGNTLLAQIGPGWMRDRMEAVGWNVAAIGIIATELALAVMIHIRRLQPVAFGIGIAFHLAIELVGFKIGLFTYFMLALYLLLLPERWLTAISTRFSRWRAPTAIDVTGTRGRAIALALIGAGAILLFAGAVGSMSLTPGIVVSVLAFASLGIAPRPVRLGLAHVAACALALVTALASDATRDYHRFWASALRDSGQAEQAVPIYERAVAIDPDFGQGRTALGNLYRRLGRHHDALIQFELAQKLDPDNWRPYAGEALTAEALGERDRARDAARRTLERNPGQRDARRILDSGQ